jgi:hypothetical protein
MLTVNCCNIHALYKMIFSNKLDLFWTTHLFLYNCRELFSTVKGFIVLAQEKEIKSKFEKVNLLIPHVRITEVFILLTHSKFLVEEKNGEMLF